MSLTVEDQPVKGPLSAATGRFPGARRRQITDLVMHVVLLLVMIATVAVLVWVLFYVGEQGLEISRTGVPDPDAAR